MQRSGATRAISGVIILGLGLIFLLNNTGIIDAGGLSDWWPLILIAFGIMMLVSNIRNLFGLFLVILGGAYQLRELGAIDFSPWQIIWPLLIIFVGASILFRHAYHGGRVSKNERDDLTAIMAGVNSTNTSKDFKEAHVTTIMGGGRLDLRQATIKDGALIEVFSFWGGVELVVPKDVIIKNQVNNILAGTEDKTSQETDKKSPTLTIAGDLIMAGITIRNTPSEQ